MAIAQNFPTISPSLSLDFANVQALDPRITYTRASTATYYGTRTAKAEENLLLQSQTFDNASWGTIDQPITKTANSSIAPDGTTTADTIAETAATGNFGIQQDFPLLANTTYVFSYFVKDVDIRYVGLTVAGAANNYAYVEFDLTGVSVNRSGAVGTGWSLVSSSITASTQSFYRVVAVITTGTTVTTPRQRIFLSDGSGAIGTNGLPSYTGTNKSAYFWGAQVEQRSAVTAYTVTTTQPITNYIPVLESAASGVARFDHNPTTFESLGFLIEEQRANVLTYSDDLSNAAWGKSQISIDSNTIIAPDGTLTGDKFIPNTVSTTHILTRSSLTSAAYTFSIYAKAGGETLFSMWLRSASVYGQFDLSNGTIVGNSASVTATITAVGNGWYRCSVYDATPGTTAAIYGRNGGSFAGDGFDGIYFWGGQAEAGAFATSYIPTVASQVTRAADSASMTGTNFSSWFNNAQGTLYAEAQSNAVTAGTNRFFCDVTGTSGNRISLLTDSISAGQAGMYVLANSADQAYIIAASAKLLSSGQKVAGAYQTNSFQAVNNGTAGTQDTTGIVPLVSTIHFGGSGFSTLAAVYMSGTIKKFSYYPIRLTNAQLQALTS